MQNLLDGHSFKPVICKNSARLASQRRIRGASRGQLKDTPGEPNAEDPKVGDNQKES